MKFQGKNQIIKTAVLVLCLGLFLCLAFAASAVTFRYHYDEKGQLITAEDSTGKVVQYVYDPVGNLLETIVATQTTKPIITNVNPNILRQGEVKNIILTGSSLLGAKIISPTSALTVSNVRADKNSVLLTLSASKSAPLGAQTFSVANNIGSTHFSLTIRTAMPVIEISPTPVVLVNDGKTVSYNLRLDKPDDVDHVITLTMADPSIATVDQTAFTLPAGQQEIGLINLLGLQVGNTMINLSSSDLSLQAIGVYVTTPYTGPLYRTSSAIRIYKQSASNPLLNAQGPYVTKPIRVMKQSTDNPLLNAPGPILSRAVRVYKQSASNPLLNAPGPIVSRAVRVYKQSKTNPALNMQGPYTTRPVRVYKQSTSNPALNMQGPYTAHPIRVVRPTTANLASPLAPSVAVGVATTQTVKASSQSSLASKPSKQAAIGKSKGDKGLKKTGKTKIQQKK
jgi:YD repeat-containing protein